jgi:hypothetical protein
MSRWIGLSVLSMVELVELLYRLLRKRIKLWKKQQRVHSAQPQVQPTKVETSGVIKVGSGGAKPPRLRFEPYRRTAYFHGIRPSPSRVQQAKPSRVIPPVKS